MLQRDDDEHHIPADWRAPFEQIVGALRHGDLQLRANPIAHVEPIDPETAQSIGDNIEAYGAKLADLDAAVWQRAIYRWMEGYWQFLVDLSTSEEAISDLVLHARLDDTPGARLRIQSVHVP